MSLSDVFAAISVLEAEYARTWDVGDGEGWASVFTEDGVFEIATVGGREGQRFQGRDVLRSMCERHNQKYEGLHLMHAPALVVDGDSASARVHFEWEASSRAGVGYSVRRRTLGYYDVSYVLIGQHWLMSRRVERPVNETISRFFGV